MLSLNDLLKDLLVERQIRHGPPQPPVLLLKGPQPLDLIIAHPPALLPPASQGLLADLELLTDRRHALAGSRELVGLPQLTDDLFGGVMLAFHRMDLSGAFLPGLISSALARVFQAGSPPLGLSRPTARQACSGSTGSRQSP